MTAWYNEIDPSAAAWLRELIKAGLIADGEVDERDIQDICSTDLLGFTQCHFFAGIGVWSYALRRAGWPDDRPVWTGSCPCQPFSAAGKGGGFDDERHLWPSWYWLIEQRRPPVLFGEQVASKDAEPWLDLVQADLEALGYALGAVPFPSAGIGAPHIRDRLYWTATRDGDDQWPGSPACSAATYGAPSSHQSAPAARDGAGANDAGRQKASGPSGLDDAGSARLEGQRSGHQAARGQRQGSLRPVAEAGEPGGLADVPGSRRREERADIGRLHVGDRSQGFAAGLGAGSSDMRPGQVNGLWRDADWLFCRDGKWRPVEPGTFPLANGAPARVGRLRGYGNAINAEAATAFISSCLELFV